MKEEEEKNELEYGIVKKRENGKIKCKKRKIMVKEIEIKGKNKYVFTQVETAIMDNGYN